MIENVAMLKMLLEQPEEKDEDPKTFEENPMEFILDKYVSLNEIMTELMTKDYREYLDAVFIVAPKPTSFKIILHNGQYFYMTYMGPAYEASVAGKNYYLSNIGEKERCMIAISKLLRGGSPLKTKGPEGAEQEASAEEGGEEGGGSSLSATGGAETGGGEQEAPQLTESKLIESIIKKSILLKEKVVEKKLDFYGSVLDAIKANDPTAKRDTKNGGLHVRATIGGEKEAIDTIKKSLQSIKLSSTDYSVEVVAPNQFSKGSRSGKFNTYKITLKKDKGDFKSGDTVLIVSTVTEGKTTITAKSLSPTSLGLSGKSFMKAEKIVESVERNIKDFKNKQLSKTMSLLMRDLLGLKGKAYASVSEIEAYSQSVPFSNETKKIISETLPGDLDIIGKDFGEVLGAILMAKKVKLSEGGVNFPGGNEPLIDFYVDGYGISSKYKAGAAATLTKIVSQAETKKLSKSEKFLHSILLQSYKEKKVSEGYLYLAKKLNIPAVQALSTIMKTSVDGLTTQSINDFVIKMISKAKKDKEKDELILNKLKPFYEAIGSTPSTPINWEKLSANKKYYGLVMGPMAAGVAKHMNGNEQYSTALKEMISKQEIKQLYLDFSLSSNSMNFELKSFANPKATFKFVPSNISVYNPDNGNMGFIMK